MTKSELLQTAKPIFFNTDMVCSVLYGKSVTRRKIPGKIVLNSETEHQVCFFPDGLRKDRGREIKSIQYFTLESFTEHEARYKKGDTLYVRETWGEWTDGYVYRAWTSPFPQAGCYPGTKWKPSIHMPKEAARIFLRVTDVRVERLHDITEEQAIKEGFKGVRCSCGGTAYACTDCYNTGWAEPPHVGFMYTWDSTVKKKDLALYGWDANPWVWVIEFERIVPDGF